MAKYTVHSGLMHSDIEATSLDATLNAVQKLIIRTNSDIRICNERGNIVAWSRW